MKIESKKTIRWIREQAWDWHRRTPWLCVFNQLRHGQ
jgi:hypothetical protein